MLRSPCFRAGPDLPAERFATNGMPVCGGEWRSVKRIMAIIMIDKIYQYGYHGKACFFERSGAHGNPATRDVSGGCKLRRLSPRGRGAACKPAGRERAHPCLGRIAWYPPF